MLDSYVFINNERGIVFTLYKNATADIVTIEFTKKYENISLIVLLVHGIITSLINLNIGILHVLATHSKFELTFCNALYAIKYGEAMKCTIFTNTSIIKVLYMKLSLKLIVYESPNTTPGIANDKIVKI